MPRMGDHAVAAVVLHRVEVHPPGVARARRRVLGLGERGPGDLGLDGVAVVDVGVVVEGPVDDDGARQVGAPLLVAERAAAVAVRRVVVVVLGVEDEVLRVDLDLVVVLVVAVAVGVEHHLDGVLLPEVRILRAVGPAAVHLLVEDLEAEVEELVVPEGGRCPASGCAGFSLPEPTSTKGPVLAACAQAGSSRPARRRRSRRRWGACGRSSPRCARRERRRRLVGLRRPRASARRDAAGLGERRAASATRAAVAGEAVTSTTQRGQDESAHGSLTCRPFLRASRSRLRCAFLALRSVALSDFILVMLGPSGPPMPGIPMPGKPPCRACRPSRGSRPSRASRPCPGMPGMPPPRHHLLHVPGHGHLLHPGDLAHHPEVLAEAAHHLLHEQELLHELASRPRASTRSPSRCGRRGRGSRMSA